jgi:hypothetical protein
MSTSIGPNCQNEQYNTKFDQKIIKNNENLIIKNEKIHLDEITNCEFPSNIDITDKVDVDTITDDSNNNKSKEILNDLDTKVLPAVSDFSAGMGDSISCNATKKIRQFLGQDETVKYESGAYSTGTYAGTAHSLLSMTFGINNGIDVVKGAVDYFSYNVASEAIDSLDTESLGKKTFDSLKRSGENEAKYAEIESEMGENIRKSISNSINI